MNIFVSLFIIALYFTAGIMWQAMFFNLSSKQMLDTLLNNFPNAKEKNVRTAILISRILVATCWPYYLVIDTISNIVRKKDDKTNDT